MNHIDRILVPIDESEASCFALTQAFDVARRYDANVEVLHTWTVPVTPQAVPHGLPPAPAAASDFEAAAKDRLDTVMARFPPPAGVGVTACLEQGDAKERILDHAEKADLVVMATAGKSGLERLLMGSTTEHVVRHAACPVLTVRQRGSIDRT